MSESIFIDDGCMNTGRIEKVPGLFPRVAALYRHALPDEWKRYQMAARNGIIDSGTETEMILSHVVSIHTVDDQGNRSPALPLTEHNAARLHLVIRLQLLNLIGGWSAPDLEASLKNSVKG